MKPILFDFSSAAKADAAKGRIVAMFAKLGAEVASSEMDATSKKTAGIAYRKLQLTFADSQTVTFMVKETGDIFQVLLNDKPLPLRQQTDPAKSVAEIAGQMTAGRASWQKKLARARVASEKRAGEGGGDEGGRGLATRLLRRRKLSDIVAEKQGIVAAKREELSGINAEIEAIRAPA